MSKHDSEYSRLSRFIGVLGISFLGISVTMLLFSIMPLIEWHMSILLLYFMFVFLFGGTVLLTAGVCGIVRQHFENYRNLLTLLVAILVPSSILMPFCYWWFSPVTIAF